MHYFGLLVLFGLGIYGLTLLGLRAYPRVRELKPFVSLVLGVVLAWLANMNMWQGFGIAHLRYAWVGVTLTGIALGGVALFFEALLGFFVGLNRKIEDQAAELEHRDLKRVA